MHLMITLGLGLGAVYLVLLAYLDNLARRSERTSGYETGGRADIVAFHIETFRHDPPRRPIFVRKSLTSLDAEIDDLLSSGGNADLVCRVIQGFYRLHRRPLGMLARRFPSALRPLVGSCLAMAQRVSTS